MAPSFPPTYRLAVFACYLVALPLIVFGAVRAWQSNANKPSDWLPEKFESTQTLRWYIDHFGSDLLLVVSWEGCTQDDPRLEELAKRLNEPVYFDGDEALKPFRTVYTPERMIQQLTEEPAELKRAEAEDRIQGWLVGPKTEGKLRTGALMVSVTPVGWENRAETIDYVFEMTRDVTGLPDEEVYIAGTLIDSVAIDRTSQQSMLMLAVTAVVLSFVVTYVCLRSVLLACMVLMVAASGEMLVLASVYFSGDTMDSVLLMAPVLVLMLGISGGIHLVNYYRDAVEQFGQLHAPKRAMQYGWVPCTLAAVTTAMGLISLCVSDLAPVQKFGAYSSSGVLAGVGMLFLVLPVMLDQFPPQGWARHAEGERARTKRGRAWRYLFRFVVIQRYPIVALAGVALIAGFVGIRDIRTTARLHDMFYDDARILRDYHWLEENIGGLVPMAVILRVPEAAHADEQYPMLWSLELVEAVEQAVRETEGVETTISPVTFTPNVPKPPQPTERLSFRKLSRLRAYERILTNNRDLLDDAGFLRTAEDHGEPEDLWQITMRVSASSGCDYNAVLQQMKDDIDAIIADTRIAKDVTIEVKYCGGLPIVQQSQDQMLEDLIMSFLIAFVFIAVAMIMVLRSPLAGTFSMIPNIFPCVTVFGMMGLMGTRIEVGSMMTATAAMGIAVDGTLHYLTWFRRGVMQGLSRTEAVLLAYRRCGAAMLQTTLIFSLGMAVMIFSPFVPYARFGWLMCTLLSVALIGDLVVLPAMLVSPLGRVFEPRKRIPRGGLEGGGGEAEG